MYLIKIYTTRQHKTKKTINFIHTKCIKANTESNICYKCIQNIIHLKIFLYIDIYIYIYIYIYKRRLTKTIYKML